MGGNSSSGGNGGNSYSNAQKARKAAVKGTKIGFKGTYKDDINPDDNTQTKKKNILEKIAEKSPTLNFIKMITKPGEKVNREYFDTKVKPSGKSKYNTYEDYIRARSKGEVDAYGREITQSDRDGPSQKSIEQPKVEAQMDNTEVKSDLITAKDQHLLR